MIKENASKEDILKQISAIQQGIEGSRTILISPESLLLKGFLVCLIPFFQLATQDFSFGNEYLEHNTFLIPYIHVLFYWSLFYFTGRIFLRKYDLRDRLEQEGRHPLIAKVCSLKREILWVLFAMIIALVHISKAELIHPIVLMLLGLIFSLYGKFTKKIVSYVGRAFILGGFLYLFFLDLRTSSDFLHKYLWIFMVLFNGLGLCLMGFVLKIRSTQLVD